MGTRADFYIKKQASTELEWCGSIAWDGDEIDDVEKASSEKSFRKLLKEFLDSRDDATFPDDGWPWPWKNSKLTDETWVFIVHKNGRGKIWRCYEKEGSYEDIKTPLIFAPWDKQPEYDEDDKKKPMDPKYSQKIFMPDMSKYQNVTMGERSGLLVMKF